jgi:hypothetical protein
MLVLVFWGCLWLIILGVFLHGWGRKWHGVLTTESNSIA